jgi:hypothetical protein
LLGLPLLCLAFLLQLGQLRFVFGLVEGHIGGDVPEASLQCSDLLKQPLFGLLPRWAGVFVLNLGHFVDQILGLLPEGFVLLLLDVPFPEEALELFLLLGFVGCHLLPHLLAPALKCSDLIQQFLLGLLAAPVGLLLEGGP